MDDNTHGDRKDNKGENILSSVDKTFFLCYPPRFMVVDGLEMMLKAQIYGMTKSKTMNSESVTLSWPFLAAKTEK